MTTAFHPFCLAVRIFLSLANGIIFKSSALQHRFVGDVIVCTLPIASNHLALHPNDLRRNLHIQVPSQPPHQDHKKYYSKRASSFFRFLLFPPIRKQKFSILCPSKARKEYY